MVKSLEGKRPVGFFPGPKGRGEPRRQRPTTQNQGSIGEEREEGGEDSHPELVRGHRGMGAGSAVEKNLVPHGEEALGVFTPQREGGRKQSD